MRGLKKINYCNRQACRDCAIRLQCTGAQFRYVSRLEPTKRDAGGLKIVSAHSGLRQHLGMVPMYRAQALSQFEPFFGQSNVDRTAVVHRALMREIFVLHHLLDVIGDIRAEIAPAQSEFADCHFGITYIEKHHCLDVVDVVNPPPLQLQLHHLQELAVQTLDIRKDFQVWIIHRLPPSRHAS
jgi:hypothetical protein